MRLEIGYTNRDYTMNWLLSFGDKVKVLEPADMAEEAAEMLAKCSEVTLKGVFSRYLFTKRKRAV